MLQTPLTNAKQLSATLILTRLFCHHDERKQDSVHLIPEWEVSDGGEIKANPSAPPGRESGAEPLCSGLKPGMPAIGK